MDYKNKYLKYKLKYLNLLKTQYGGFERNHKFTTKQELIIAIKSRDKMKDDGTVNSWDVSAITDMSYLFFDISFFNENINLWDVSKVTIMKGMFKGSSFNKPLKWDTSLVTDMESMFEFTIFNKPLEINTTNVTTMKSMFKDSAFNQPLNFDTSHVTSMKYMFKNSRYNQPLKFDISSVTNMEEMFTNSHFNKNISTWEIQEHVNINNIFKDSALIEEYKPFKIDVDLTEELITLPPTITKSITIYIKTHGTNDSKSDKPLPKSILNTAVGAPTGLCTISNDLETVKDILNIIHKYEEIYKGKISDGNIIFGPEYKAIREEYINAMWISKKLPKIGIKSGKFNELQLKNEYLAPKKPEDYFRSFTKNRYYGIMNDRKCVVSGIYVIDKNFPFKGETVDYLPIEINASMDNFNKDDYVGKGLGQTRGDLVLSLHDYHELQKRNLLNSQVVENIGKIYGIDLSSVFSRPTTKKNTYIEHYEGVWLSEILEFFKLLGYDHVNIIDLACRSNRSGNPKDRRRDSITERELYKLAKEKYHFGGSN